VAVLLPLALIESRRRPGRFQSSGPSLRGGIAGLGAVAGGAFFLGSFLQQQGLETATVRNAGFLTGLYVVITPLLEWGLTRRLPRPIVWWAVGLSFVGTWLLGGGSLGGFSQGDLLEAGGAAFWAVQMIVSGRSAGMNRPLAFNTLQFAVVGLIAAVGAFAFEDVNWADIRAAGVSILYVGILSSALTFTLMTIAMTRTSATEASVIVSLEAVFAALAGAIFLDERTSGLGIAGAALILVAILAVSVSAARVS
jgi:drug/metabolite transporter (DMT)-like permease